MTAAIGQVIRQLLLLCYYNYLIRRAVNIMSAIAEKTCIKVDRFGSTLSQFIASQVSYPLPSPSPQGYSGTSPLGHPYPRDSSIQETQKVVTIKTHAYSGERDTFSGSQNPGLTSIHGTPWLTGTWCVTDHKKG